MRVQHHLPPPTQIPWAITHQCDPGSLAAVSTKYVHDHQGSSGHEAKYRHEHHPALDEGNGHQGGGDQDPDQASKDLQGGDREYWSRTLGLLIPRKGTKRVAKIFLLSPKAAG